MNRIYTVFFITVAAVTEALFGLCLGRTFDNFNMTSLDTLSHLIVGMIALIIVNIGSSIGARKLMFKNASEQTQKLKNHIYETQIFLARGKNPDIADFTSKMDLLFDNYFMSKQFILLYSATFLCASMAIISIDWIIFLVAFFTSAVPFVIPILFKRAVQDAATDYAERSTVYTGFVTNTLYGRLELIKYNVAMKYIEKHECENSAFEEKRKKNLDMGYIAEKTTEGIGNLMYVCVLLAGGILVVRNKVTIGDVVSTVQLMNGTVGPITLIISYVNKINSCKPLYKSLMEADITEKKRNVAIVSELKKNNLAPLVADQISFGYDTEKRDVIVDFSFSFMPGKKYLIEGASGTGKTTLAKLLSGELVPKCGSVKVGEYEIGKIPIDQRRRIVNYAEQDSYLFQDTVLHNITLYRDIKNEKEIERQLKDLCLNYVKSDTRVEDFNRLSGGERARICLLRAMLEMPDVLIVDEPTATLDRVNAENVIRYLCQCSETIIVIGHNLDEKSKKLFDEIINL